MMDSLYTLRDALHNSSIMSAQSIWFDVIA